MQIDGHKVVTLDYTLKDDSGTVLDSTSGRGDFTYLHGFKNIIPGLENALSGKKIGDSFSVRIEPGHAYGERNDDMVQTVARDQFDSVEELEVGMQFQGQSPNGQMMIVTVTDIKDDEVTIDANHPLAGVTLNFDVKVVGIRDATPDEIEHRHVHGPGGHH